MFLSVLMRCCVCIHCTLCIKKKSVVLIFVTKVSPIFELLKNTFNVYNTSQFFSAYSHVHTSTPTSTPCCFMIQVDSRLQDLLYVYQSTLSMLESLTIEVAPFGPRTVFFVSVLMRCCVCFPLHWKIVWYYLSQQKFQYLSFSKTHLVCTTHHNY